MATIEISGPDDQGQYSVEVESDDQESAEQQGPGAGDSGVGDNAVAPAGPGAAASTGNSVTCGSVKEVLQVVKQILQGGPAQAANPQDMWNQEAGKTAAAKQQSSQYGA